LVVDHDHDNPTVLVRGQQPEQAGGGRLVEPGCGALAEPSLERRPRGTADPPWRLDVLGPAAHQQRLAQGVVASSTGQTSSASRPASLSSAPRVNSRNPKASRTCAR